MSEQYEPSYYEIALTGRQVLAAFVILLVCLVAAFFSGVWVGRGGAAPEGDRPEAAGVEARETRPEELSFFEEEPMRRPRELGEVAREPRPDATLREEVDDRSGSAAAGAAEPGRGATPEPPPPPPPPAGAAPGQPSPQPSAQPSTAPSGSLATGDLVIQILVSSEEAKAREVLDRLRSHGFRAFLSPVTDRGRTLYRVRVGPFEQKSEAEAVAERLRATLGLETWITQ